MDGGAEVKLKPFGARVEPQSPDGILHVLADGFAQQQQHTAMVPCVSGVRRLALARSRNPF